MIDIFTMIKHAGHRTLVWMIRNLRRDLGYPLPRKRLDCPVCGSRSIRLEYAHTEFRGVKVRVCGHCEHGYGDRDYVIKRSGIWKSRQDRADYHLSEVIPKWIGRTDGVFLEIGSCDFYFLSRLKSLFPRLDLHGYDKYALVEPPAGIHLITELAQIGKVDYVYASHSLEHIYDLGAFLEELSGRMAHGALLIAEVPNNSIEKHMEARAGQHFTGWHFHFFTGASFKAMMLQHGFCDVQLYCYGPSQWGLSEGVYVVGVFTRLTSGQ